ncbi:MAG: GspH/FimT family pseudopilin, partial [Natronospirillum sp.]
VCLMNYEKSSVIVRSRGYNLLELMTTVAIAGIVALIGIPLMASMIENARVRSVASDLTMAVSLARNEAVRQGADMLVLAAGTPADYDKGWCVVPAGADCEADSLIRLFNPPGDVAFVTVPNNSTSMTFNRQGVNTDGTESVSVQPSTCTSGDNRARTMTISPSGRPNVAAEACP